MAQVVEGLPSNQSLIQTPVPQKEKKQVWGSPLKKSKYIVTDLIIYLVNEACNVFILNNNQ
jgi:hypothetical protein